MLTALNALVHTNCSAHNSSIQLRIEIESEPWKATGLVASLVTLTTLYLTRSLSIVNIDRKLGHWCWRWWAWLHKLIDTVLLVTQNWLVTHCVSQPEIFNRIVSLTSTGYSVANVWFKVEEKIIFPPLCDARSEIKPKAHTLFVLYCCLFHETHNKSCTKRGSSFECGCVICNVMKISCHHKTR